ncbi:hypothetical protein D0Z07_1588 [Hyphodiscus hymeniophilus]|uniref:Uncharacterized protein n=1 Tax=Hyphodiscus hymeniophilus TaxID=353542 RepID=A0A9P6VNJ2_9HELO|nr:hypothetical protein D0Z07_1588 [Hyphodiscus hymeniophilus]
MLGYSFDQSLTYKALVELSKHSPDIPTALILDSGSTDSGPAKLALGSMTCPRSAYERDLRSLMSLSHEFGVPILIGSAGGDGTDTHVDEFLDIIQEITDEPDNELYHFKTLAIYSNVSKTTVLKSLHAGKITGCGLSVPKLTEDDVNNAVTIVAQIGPEPFLDAMKTEPDFNIVIGGRAYDPSPYTAFSIFHARSLASKVLTDEQIGGFTHMGKIMECGALCAKPKSLTSMATIYLDGSFDVKPLDSGARCTPLSVAAHTLYEKSRPDILAGPGGSLDLRNTTYRQLDDGISVQVHGATFAWLKDSDAPYTVKLEAAKLKGYRTIFMGGIRDPILIGQIDSYLSKVKTRVQSLHGDAEGDCVNFHVYGSNGIMNDLEPGDVAYLPREIFIVGEALAATQKLANSISSSARVALMHGSYPGQRGTGGNFAMGIGGKLEIEMGPGAEFCLYHLMDLPVGTEGAYQIKNETEEGAPAAVAQSPHPLFSWRAIAIGKGDPRIGTKDRKIAEHNERYTSPIPGKVVKQATPNFPTGDPLLLTKTSTLSEIAPVIRSKNSGPYDITLDVVFSSPEIYALTKASSLLTTATIARLYHLDESEIIWCGFFDQAMAFKATIPRKRGGVFVSSGAYMETDVHASQQYAGLLDLTLPEELRVKIMELGLERID